VQTRMGRIEESGHGTRSRDQQPPDSRTVFDAPNVQASIVGYIVLPLFPIGLPTFFPTLEAAMTQGECDWIARVWSDGTVTAGDRSDGGLCGMGLCASAPKWDPF
jgi:hypothetical protein